MVLGVLVVLLGVMTWALKKATEKPEPPKIDPKQQEIMLQKQMESRKKEMAMRQKQMKQYQLRKDGKARPKDLNPPPSPASTMDINGNWFRNDEEGQAGLLQIQKRREQQDKAERERVQKAMMNKMSLPPPSPMSHSSPTGK
jgi:hypothetical protein